MAKLIFTNQNYAGRVYKLVVEKTTVGRADQNTLVIQDSSLSSKHCEILMNGPEVIVRDLGSRNGTFVNGAKLIDQQCQLKSGQAVRFGSVEARLELEGLSTEDTEITAIHAMSRIMREQIRERKNFQPVAASLTLEPSDASAMQEHTVIASRPSAPEEGAITAAPEPAKPVTDKTSKRSMMVITLIVVLSLVVILWLLRTR